MSPHDPMQNLSIPMTMCVKGLVPQVQFSITNLHHLQTVYECIYMSCYWYPTKCNYLSNLCFTSGPVHKSCKVELFYTLICFNVSRTYFIKRFFAQVLPRNQTPLSKCGPTSRCKLRIPRVSESNRCNYRSQGPLGNDYFGTTIFFPANFVTLLAIIWLDGEHYFSAGMYTPNNIKL